MADTKAIVTIRSKQAIYFPPAEKGFDDLMKPNEYKGERHFNLNGHFSAEALALIPAIVQKQCYDLLLDKLHAEIEEGGGRKKPPLDPSEWLEGKLKQPTRKAEPKLPFIKFSREAETKTGKPIVMGCWGPDGQVLDLGKLRMAMGSIIQPALFLNLWASKANSWVPQPSVKLVGVKVLKLVQFQGSGAARPQDDDEAIKAVLGASFEGGDLSAFVLGETAPVHADENEDAPGNVEKMF